MSSYASVNVTVTDRMTAEPLVGVVMKVLSQDGRLIFSQVITDASGTASLLLPAPAVYQARFYRFGVSFVGALHGPSALRREWVLPYPEWRGGVLGRHALHRQVRPASSRRRPDPA